MKQIASTAHIYPNVTLGENVVIEDFCVIGCPPRGAQPGDYETVIGDNSTIRSHVVIYAGNTLGKNVHLGHKANVREHNRIGDEVSIGTLTVIEHHVEIQSRVRIHSQAFVPEHSVLMEGAWIGPNVVITNAKYPNFPDTKEHLQGVVVEQMARIGANATILAGLRIGRGSLIGAGSVVTKDVPPEMVVAGNPARVIRAVNDIGSLRGASGKSG